MMKETGFFGLFLICFSRIYYQINIDGPRGVMCMIQANGMTGGIFLKRIRYIMVLAAVILLTVCMPESRGSYVYAAAVEDNVLRHDIERGIWTYSTVDTKHTSAICWKTIGFHVTTKKYADCNPRKPWGTLMLQGYGANGVGKKKTENIGGGKLRTTFTWTDAEMDKVIKKAGVTADWLEKKGNTLYLHAIIQVYNAKTGENIGSPKYTNSAISTAAAWKNPNDFRDHFNIPVKYETTTKVPVYIRKWIWDSTTSSWQSYGEREYKGEYTLFSKYKAPQMPGFLMINDKKYWLARTDWNERGVTPVKYKDKVIADGNPWINETAYVKSVNEKVQKRKYSIDGEKGIVINYRYKKFAKPKKDDDGLKLLEPSLSCIINSREYQNEQYESSEAIPSTEEQYIRVTCNEYLYDIAYKDITRTVTFYGKKGRKAVRRYYYTQITKMNVWRVKHADVTNKSLPDSEHGANLQRITDQELDGLKYVIYGKEEADHIIREPLLGSDRLPVGGPLGEYQCASDFCELYSSNDGLLFSVGFNNGEPYICDSFGILVGDGDVDGQIEKNPNERVLYQTGYVIPKLTQNEEYQSVCTIYYRSLTYYRADTMDAVARYNSAYDLYEGHDCGYGSQFDATIDSESEPERINPVTVLTPTICDGQVMIDGNNNQELHPLSLENPQIVLDHVFSIYLPTEGWHSDRKGYMERDYARFMEKRQVRFTFDCYSKDKTTFYPKNTWIELGESTEMYFYLPTWVDESYVEEANVKFRTIAINNIKTRVRCQELANYDGEVYYGAVDLTPVHISGSIFNLKLYDISDYPFWQSVFRKADSLELKDYFYTVGTKDKDGFETGQDGKYIFPLMEGSHRFYVNRGAVKSGYVWRFSVNTIGNYVHENDAVRIIPSFYYVKADGTRQKVDVWYNATGKDSKKEYLVKVGSKQDSTNRKTMYPGNIYTSIPDVEIEKKAEYTGVTEESIRNDKREVYYYGKINAGSNMKTYIGTQFVPDNTLPEGITEKKAGMSVQKWYFQYHLPSDIHICPAGTDVLGYGNNNNGIDYTEDFWITGSGYLDINFDIQTIKGVGSMIGSTPEYSVDITDYDDPVYSDWFDLEGVKIWTAKTEDETDVMSESEFMAWEELYNSYEEWQLYDDKETAIAAGNANEEAAEDIREENRLDAPPEESDKNQITEDIFEQGVPYLSYINEANFLLGYANMWVREGFNPDRTDAEGMKYSLKYGDVLFCYLPGRSNSSRPDESPAPGTTPSPDDRQNSSAADDYKSSGTN